jgi:ABC-2 type transport system permease protein
MSEELELREQNPEISFFAGPIACIQTMFSDWYLIRNLVKKDLRARYKRAALGYGWTFLEPFLLSAVYYALFTILAGNPEKLYSMWVLLGVIVWGHFSRSLQGTVACLSRGGGLIKQVYFPREILAFSPVLSQLVVAMLSLTAVIPVMLYLGVTPTSSLWMVAVGLVLTTMIAMGVGMLVAPLNAISEDVGHLFRFITRAGFFVSPVMWTYEMMLSRASSQWADIIMLNPMVVPLTLVRHGIDGTPLTLEMNHILYSIGFAVLSLYIGAAVFKRWEARVVKYL